MTYTEFTFLNKGGLLDEVIGSVIYSMLRHVFVILHTMKSLAQHFEVLSF